MAYDTKIEIRMSTDDLSLIEKVMKYRLKQGVLKKEALSEYVRYLLNRDITEAVEEIKNRRK